MNGVNKESVSASMATYYALAVSRGPVSLKGDGGVISDAVIVLKRIGNEIKGFVRGSKAAGF